MSAPPSPVTFDGARRLVRARQGGIAMLRVRLVSALMFGLLICAGAGCTPSQPADAALAPAPDPEADHAALIARIDQFNRTIREGDKDGYADVFVDDFVFTWSRNGQIYDREMILPNVVPTPEYDPIVDEVKTRIYGDSAIVNYRVRQKSDEPGARVTFSYARIDGVWKVVASHSTKIVTADDETAEDAEDAEGDAEGDAESE